MYDMICIAMNFCLFDAKEFIPWPPRAHCHLAGVALVSVVAPVNQKFQGFWPKFSQCSFVESSKTIVARIVCSNPVFHIGIYLYGGYGFDVNHIPLTNFFLNKILPLTCNQLARRWNV